MEPIGCKTFIETFVSDTWQNPPATGRALAKGIAFAVVLNSIPLSRWWVTRQIDLGLKIRYGCSYNELRAATAAARGANRHLRPVLVDLAWTVIELAAACAAPSLWTLGRLANRVTPLAIAGLQSALPQRLSPS
jgi:hypothetical protein